MKALLPWPSDTVNHTIDRVVKVHQEDWDGITDKVSEQQIDNKSKNRPQQPSPAPNDEAILVLLSILQKWKPLHIWKHLMRGEALGETLEKQNKCSIMIILYIVFNIKLRTSHTQTMHIILSSILSYLKIEKWRKKLSNDNNWTAKRPATYMAWFTFQVCPSWLSPPRAKNIVICTETKPANLNVWRIRGTQLNKPRPFKPWSFRGQISQEGCNWYYVY